jgi:long-chain acyl-CoA synthetase
VYDERPWLSLYPEGSPADIELEYDSALAMFAAAVQRAPDRPLLKYFDGTLTAREVDEMTDALAAALLDGGFSAGDRLAVYLQNTPAFVLGMVATWKAGGIMVSINPMNRQREVQLLLTDSGAKVLLSQDDLYRDVASQVLESTDVQRVITTSPLDFQTRNDERLFEKTERVQSEGTEDLLELIESHRGKTPPPVSLHLDDTAFLTYTSGTTGPPKGARNTHRNVVFNAQVYRDWIGLDGNDSVFGVAPLFHITGLIGHIAVCLLVPMPLVLAYRFEPNVVLDALAEHRPTFTVGSITVFTALMNASGFDKEHFSSFKAIYSGGAPIAPSTANRFLDATGIYIHNIYGLTETTSPSHGVPFGAKAPVDETSGALSVGVPVFNTIVRIQDDDGKDLPAGEIGEIVTEGPEVVPGYWNKPEETEKALPGGSLHTGDVGFMDENGWYYIVDRKKDQINASGYKVWPREVEDVLVEHPAVKEAAVVGVPDEYRGESVKAFVSLNPGQSADEQELIAFCKERMAAYKYPRQVELIDELPKTVTGKILRRQLRDTTAEKAPSTSG